MKNVIRYDLFQFLVPINANYYQSIRKNNYFEKKKNRLLIAKCDKSFKYILQKKKEIIYSMKKLMHYFFNFI